jgi:NADH-quinone oxidoreductase subunit K
MTPITIQTLLIAAGLFSIGLIGFLVRKNIILMFLSVELMLAGVATNFIAFGAHHGNPQGQLFAVLILTVASCEAAMALALVVALYRRNPTLNIFAWSRLHEVESDQVKEQLTGEVADEEIIHPKLTPAGNDPMTVLTPERGMPGSLRDTAGDLPAQKA